MGNICKGESRRSDPEIELAPRVAAQRQQAPANVRPVPEPNAAPEASLGTNNRRTQHDPTPSTKQPRKQCRAYAKGYCEKGDTCTFLHKILKNVDKEERLKDDKRTLDSLREFRGAWVEFGPGATTFQVALPSDFSAIRIDNVPSVRDQDIFGLVPKMYRPFQIQVQYLAYTNDADTESTFVRSMLDEFGPFEQWGVSGMSDGGEIKAQAVFLEESQARNAAAALDGKRLPFSKSRRLIAEVVTSVRFDVLYRVYVAVQDQIDARKRSWEEQNIQFTDFPPRDCSLTLHLKGSNRESMAKAKQELDLILSGDLIRHNGKNIWHPSFSDYREGDERLKTIEEEMGIVIIRDAWLSQFRVFGAEGRQEQVAEAFDRFIKNKISSSHSIPLGQENGLDLRGDLQRGLQELKSKLGKNKVVFDESSRSIIVHGSENDFAKAKLILSGGQPGPSRDRLREEQDCQICLCEAEEPIMTSCNHVYCSHCFVDLCCAIAMQPGETGIACEGDEGECGHVFDFSEIRDLLPSETFETVLETSFTTFVQTHLEKLRYCPTPDCTQVYRVSSKTEKPPPTFTCNSCLACICTGCHAAHPSITCAEHRDHTSGGLQALNTLKKKLGIQDCPGCTTSLEKTAGCDHVTCQGCNSHLCWICMAKFNHGGSCYQHLMQVHRGGDFD
ncbi:hypothetical protein CEP54_009484 [Fusarium duplospermum]|uniref:Uncharacterized protein n=1 Tax=Fusarium duplospermum TaxID=1325734 RepID=A0A428PQA3_9HYPO|nr:hypothetical protein CEP54_009484 [Fusarium duplospermum]